MAKKRRKYEKEYQRGQMDGRIASYIKIKEYLKKYDRFSTIRVRHWKKFITGQEMVYY
jgi:hypothetical protein